MYLLYYGGLCEFWANTSYPYGLGEMSWDLTYRYSTCLLSKDTSFMHCTANYSCTLCFLKYLYFCYCKANSRQNNKIWDLPSHLYLVLDYNAVENLVWGSQSSGYIRSNAKGCIFPPQFHEKFKSPDPVSFPVFVWRRNYRMYIFNLIINQNCFSQTLTDVGKYFRCWCLMQRRKSTIKWRPALTPKIDTTSGRCFDLPTLEQLHIALSWFAIGIRTALHQNVWQTLN